MSEYRPSQHDVDRFILEEIDSVPHLEALLLLRRRHPHACTVEEMAKELFIPIMRAEGVLYDLSSRGLILGEQTEGGRFCYKDDSPELAQLIDAVDTTYRRELVRVSKMIHNNASSPMRAFARAFDLRKNKGQ